MRPKIFFIAAEVMYDDQLTDNQFRNLGTQVDVLTQNNLKDIPRSRLVRFDGIPFDVHSLHTYFSKGTRKHPVYPAKNAIKNGVVAQIKKKALATGWKANVGGQMNRRVPNHLKNFSAKQATQIGRGRNRQKMKQIEHVLDGNANALARVKRIATRIVLSGLDATVTLHGENFKMVVDKVGGHVTGIQMSWGARAKAFLYPLEQTDFGLLPRPVAMDRLAQARWVMEASTRTTVPGSNRTVAQMTEALSLSLGLTIENVLQPHELMEDIRSYIDNVDLETRGQPIERRTQAMLRAMRAIDRRCARGGECGISMTQISHEEGLSILDTTEPLRNVNVDAYLRRNGPADSYIFDVVPLNLFVSVHVTPRTMYIQIVDIA
jgi:hypothetical protein